MGEAAGFTVKSGWASTVLVTGSAASIQVIDSRRIELSDPAIPESRQPYHAGFGTARASGAELSRLVSAVERFGRESVTGTIDRREHGRSGHDRQRAHSDSCARRAAVSADRRNRCRRASGPVLDLARKGTVCNRRRLASPTGVRPAEGAHRVRRQLLGFMARRTQGRDAGRVARAGRSCRTQDDCGDEETENPVVGRALRRGSLRRA